MRPAATGAKTTPMRARLPQCIQRARGQFEGFGFNIPTEDFVQEFFKEGFEDPRLKSTLFRVGDAMGDRGIFTKDATGGFSSRLLP
jgi:hypothetical protein